MNLPNHQDPPYWLKIYRRVIWPYFRGSPSRLGRYGEGLACSFLISHGYRILARNWRNYGGELDIVAYRGSTLCIIEVKTRRAAISHRWSAAAAIDDLKLTRLYRCGEAYLQAHRGLLRRLSVSGLRYDLISVEFDQRGKPTISHTAALQKAGWNEKD